MLARDRGLSMAAAGEPAGDGDGERLDVEVLGEKRRGVSESKSRASFVVELRALRTSMEVVAEVGVVGPDPPEESSTPPLPAPPPELPRFVEPPPLSLFRGDELVDLAWPMLRGGTATLFDRRRSSRVPRLASRKDRTAACRSYRSPPGRRTDMAGEHRVPQHRTKVTSGSARLSRHASGISRDSSRMRPETAARPTESPPKSRTYSANADPAIGTDLARKMVCSMTKGETEQSPIR